MASPSQPSATAAVAQASATASSDSAAEAAGPDYEGLRSILLRELQTLSRREPLEPTYRHWLMQVRSHSSRRSEAPQQKRRKLYKQIGGQLRYRVEEFMNKQHTSVVGKNREELEDGAMRAALTLREGKPHEQEALMAATPKVYRLPYGTANESQYRANMEGVAMGLQERKPKRKKHHPATTAALNQGAAGGVSTGPNEPSQGKRQQQLFIQERERQEQRAREEARKKLLEAQRLEEERKRQMETPQQKLQRLYFPIFQMLWDMEFENLNKTNPFRIVIDKDNCEAMGVPDYCDVVKTPMNLTFIQKKVENSEYPTLQAFFADVELMLNNALLYNSDPTNHFHLAAKEMKRRFKKKAKGVIATLQQKQLQQQKQGK